MHGVEWYVVSWSCSPLLCIPPLLPQARMHTSGQTCRVGDPTGRLAMEGVPLVSPRPVLLNIYLLLPFPPFLALRPSLHRCDRCSTCCHWSLVNSSPVR